MLHCEYASRGMCYLSTLRAHRLSTVMPTDVFCRKGISLHRKCPKELLAKGQPIARSCTATNTHTHIHNPTRTLAGQLLSTRCWSVASGTVGYFSDCYQCNTQPPNSDIKHSPSLFPQQPSTAAVRLVKLETTFPVEALPCRH